jgi:ribosomal protein S12 methylthiotransferase accessory factor
VTTLVDRARAEAKMCGVTRLADVTRLDVLELPVFQAVRPWGRGLSVHQGKGLTREAAMVGALMEAVECDHAEGFEGDQRRCAFDQIDPAERALSVLDFAVDGAEPLDPTEVWNWVAARSPGDGRRLWVPFDVVSLDFSRPGDRRLDRSSDGLGARFDFEGAALKALLEAIERDAERTWRALPVRHRSSSQLEAASVTCDWFESLYARARLRGLVISIYELRPVIPLAAFLCEIFEPGAGAAPRRRTAGTGCGFTAEDALLAAMAEAAQSRLTVISGVRDDLPAPASFSRIGFGVALPPSADCSLRKWEEVARPPPGAPPASLAGLAESLTAFGYPDIGLVDLSRSAHDARVVKAVVPGLGSSSRSRRPPAGPLA